MNLTTGSDSSIRHSGAGRNPGFFALRQTRRWMPVFAGMTNPLFPLRREISTIPDTDIELQSFRLFKRSAFEITDTELKVIAALAIMGLSSTPKNG